MKQPLRNKTTLASRRAAAAERAAYTSTLTPAQRLEALDRRLGKGAGAVKERARLLKALQASKAPVSKATAEAVFGVAEVKAEVKTKGKAKKIKKA